MLCASLISGAVCDKDSDGDPRTLEHGLDSGFEGHSSILTLHSFLLTFTSARQTLLAADPGRPVDERHFTLQLPVSVKIPDSLILLAGWACGEAHQMQADATSCQAINPAVFGH